MGKAMPAPDMFGGTFDNQRTAQREVWRDGRLMFFVRRNCCGLDHPNFEDQALPWGHFPDLPTNASTREPA